MIPLESEPAAANVGDGDSWWGSVSRGGWGDRGTLRLIPLESELATANVGECNPWSRNSEGESARVPGESVEIDVVSAQL